MKSTPCTCHPDKNPSSNIITTDWREEMYGKLTPPPSSFLTWLENTGRQINTHTITHAHVRAHALMHACMHARTHTRTHTCTHTYAHMHTHVHTQIAQTELTSFLFLHNYPIPVWNWSEKAWFDLIWLTKWFICALESVAWCFQSCSS